MKITRRHLRRIIREELLLEIDPSQVGGTYTDAQVEWEGQVLDDDTGETVADRMRDSLSDQPVGPLALPHAVIYAGVILGSAVGEFIIEIASVRAELTIGLGRIAGIIPHPEGQDNQDAYDQTVEAATTLAWAIILWYAPDYVVKGGIRAWGVFKNSTKMRGGKPSASDIQSLKDFRSGPLSDEAISASGAPAAEITTMKEISNVIDDAIAAGEKNIGKSVTASIVSKYKPVYKNMYQSGIPREIRYIVDAGGEQYSVQLLKTSESQPVIINFAYGADDKVFSKFGGPDYSIKGTADPRVVIDEVLEAVADFAARFPNQKRFLYSGARAGEKIRPPPLNPSRDWYPTKRDAAFNLLLRWKMQRDPAFASRIKSVEYSTAETLGGTRGKTLITIERLKRIIREELLLEIDPSQIGGTYTDAQVEWEGQVLDDDTGETVADRIRDELSATYTVGSLIADIGDATVSFFIDLGVARHALTANLAKAMDLMDEGLTSKEKGEYLTEATNNATELAIGNLWWYGPGLVFSGLRAGTRYMWPAIKNIKTSARGVPTAESQASLRQFRSEVLTDDLIAGTKGSDKVRLQRSADIIDDAIKANEKFKYQRPSYSAAVKDQRAREAIAKIRDEMDDLYWKQIYASGEDPIYITGSKAAPDEKITWDHLIKVSNETLPSSMYPVFAEKILRRMNYSRLTGKNTWVIYDSAIENTIKGSQAGVSNTGFIYDDIVKYWERIPGNPAGKGFKDYKPQAYGFHIDDVITRSEIEVIAREMFDQFPGISKVYGSQPGPGPAALADDIQQLVIKAGHTRDRGPLAGDYAAMLHGNTVEMAPWANADELAATLWEKGNVTSTIRSALRDEGVFAHELDHWLRGRVVTGTGGSWSVSRGAQSPTIKSGSKIDLWHSAHSEFEAEFTKGMKLFLDDVLERGWTDELAVALTSPAKFETYFLQRLPQREWLGAAGKDGIKHVRRRLFDTESGLYYSLRRAMGIVDSPTRLPERIDIDLHRWNILSGII